MKSLVFLSFVFLFSSVICGQTSSFARKLSVEINGSYYWMNELGNTNDNLGFNKTFSELSFSPSFNVNISDRFYVGLRNYLVRARGHILPGFTSWHYLIGPTVKYTLLREKRLELNVEVAYYFGNYCSICKPTNEDYNTSMQYIGLAMNINLQLFKDIPEWWLKLGFAVNRTLYVKHKNGSARNYNLPLLGLQYRFGKWN